MSILGHILKEIQIMALDVSKLNTAVAELTSAVSAQGEAITRIIAAHTDTSAQAAVDTAANAVELAKTSVLAGTAQIDAALSPPVVPPAA